MKTKCNIILTYDKGEQEIFDCDLNLSTRTKCLMGIMRESDRDRKLVKVSMCSHGDKEPPAWFMKCSGKIWQDELELF